LIADEGVDLQMQIFASMCNEQLRVSQQVVVLQPGKTRRKVVPVLNHIQDVCGSGDVIPRIVIFWAK
jgi:hypothetical protein